MQPWAPIHPFWPWGDKGVTNEAGEVKLSLPTGFWFYFRGVSANGYRWIQPPESYSPTTMPSGVQADFYMKRIKAR